MEIHLPVSEIMTNNFCGQTLMMILATAEKISKKVMSGTCPLDDKEEIIGKISNNDLLRISFCYWS